MAARPAHLSCIVPAIQSLHTCSKKSGAMQALKQNSSVTGAITKLRRICNGAMLSASDLPDSALCSKGPANKLAVNSVGWMIACSKPVLRSPNRLNSNLCAKAVCNTTQMSACSHTRVPLIKCCKVSISDSSLMLQTICGLCQAFCICQLLLVCMGCSTLV